MSLLPGLVRLRADALLCFRKPQLVQRGLILVDSQRPLATASLTAGVGKQEPVVARVAVRRVTDPEPRTNPGARFGLSCRAGTRHESG